MIVLSNLPAEVILHIAALVESEREVLVLAQSNQRLHNLLIDYLYRRNSQNSGDSALLWAAEHGYESTAWRALSNGASLSAANNRGDTPLLLATTAGRQRIMEFLLTIDGVDVNCHNKCEQTPLVMAARDGNTALVRLLLDQPGILPDKADIEPRPEGFRLLSRSRTPRKTPLAYAAGNGHADIVRALLRTGLVNVNSSNRLGTTPLLDAVSNGHEVVVKSLLVVPGVQLNARGSLGDTPLLRAVRGRNENIIRLLLEADDVDIEAKNDSGMTAFALAKARQYEGIKNVLLAKGCNPNVELPSFGAFSIPVCGGRGPRVATRQCG